MTTHTPKTDKSELRILRSPQVQAKTGLSRTTLWRRVKDGSFPMPVSLRGNSIGWISDEVDDWIRSLDRVSTATQTGD